MQPHADTPDALRHERNVGMIPNRCVRVGCLERRTCPQLASRVAQLEADIQELQRVNGLVSGFSLKARRALAPDTEAVLPAPRLEHTEPGFTRVPFPDEDVPLEPLILHEQQPPSN